MTTYRGGKVQDDAESSGKSDTLPPMPCRQCGDLTPRATLNTLGATCYPCFSSYCRHGPSPRPYRPDSPTVADMKTRLKARTT